MTEYKGVAYLRNKLTAKQLRVNRRYTFYEMKDRKLEQGVTIPPQLRRQYMSTLGWCAKAVDSIADRLVFREFENDNFQIMDIYRMNNPDVLFDSAILSALISSCSFIYISPDEEGFPRLQVIDGGNATGVIDPITGLLQEGYAVLKRDDKGQPLLQAHFTAEETIYHQAGTGVIRRDVNPAPYPLLVPIIYRPDARRPFGHARISRACMYLQTFAKRTLERSDIAAEFYSIPQRYVLGMSPDAERMDKWKATVSSLIQIDRDEEGEKPVMGQFQQMTMAPLSDQLKMAAANFAGETGLTTDDLGFVSDNPSSAEAIKASHETLRITAKKAQKTFGTGFLNAGYLAACLRDEVSYMRKQFYLTTAKWEPIFDPDASALTVIGDGVSKVNTAIPGYFGADNLRDLTGIRPSGGVNNAGYSSGTSGGSGAQLPE
ncbi:MAG: phage portal protein [Firmicutes bacterium]|nr:phage portal protein [Bacillota bacterium]